MDISRLPETPGEAMRDWRPEGPELLHGFGEWVQARQTGSAIFADFVKPVLEQIARELDGEISIEEFTTRTVDRLPWALYAAELPDRLTMWMIAAAAVRQWLGKPATANFH